MLFEKPLKLLAIVIMVTFVYNQAIAATFIVAKSQSRLSIFMTTRTEKLAKEPVIVMDITMEENCEEEVYEEAKLGKSALKLMKWSILILIS